MKRMLPFFTSFVLLLAVWELLALSGIFPESLFPSPQTVLLALAGLARSGELLLDVGASMYRFLTGYLSACLLAVGLGLALGWMPGVWRCVNPLVQFLRPISPVAWLPFIVLWVGIGDTPAIVIIFLAAFFPVLLTTISAIGRIDPVYTKIADNFGLGKRQTLFGIVFPAVFPQIAGGLRLAVGTAWIFLVAGEMAGSQSGLGYRIVDARNNLRVDILMAEIIVIGILGVVLEWLLRYLEDQVGTVWGFAPSEGGNETCH